MLVNRLKRSRRPQAAIRSAVAATAATFSLAVGAAGAAECPESIADLYEQVSDAVVLITAQAVNPYRLADRLQQGIGSGFIVDERGVIVTNSHVVFGAQVLAVKLDSGESVPASLLGADPLLDIAVLKIPQPDRGRLPVLRFGDSDLLRPGEDVVAIGNPLGLEQTITRGIVSGLNRVLPERPLLLSHPMIQTDAPINPGNSGGPLLNRCGEVVGVSTAIVQGSQSIGFAVPSRIVVAAVQEILDKGRVVRPWVGVQGQLVDPRLGQLFAIPLVPGFLVEVVEPGSPADKAGIKGGSLPVQIGGRALLLGGDIVTRVNGIAAGDPENFPKIVAELRVGNRLRVELFRDGQHREVSYELPERPLQPGDVPDSLQVFPVRESPPHAR
jgi:S1-C subfamily serine protease